MTVKFLLVNANFFYYISFPKTREKKKDKPKKKKTNQKVAYNSDNKVETSSTSVFR